jgi:multiple sugar transport system permease protein
LLSIGSSIVFCSMSGYALAKLRFRGRTLCFLGVLSMLMMPFELTFLPLFLMFSKAGLVNTLLGIAGPNLMSAVGVFIIRQFMQTIPNEYLDAARIDGASEYRIFAAIAVPMARPAIATLAVLKFTMTWNALLWPMVIAQDDAMMTLTVGMQKFITFYATDYGLLTSSATLSVLPLVLLFILGQRWVVSSTLMSGLKG